MIVLSCTNISKTYVTDKILDNVTFSINAGEKIGLIGINGAGKSTLFNILTGKISSDDGQIYTSKTSKIGYMKQHTSVDSSKNIYDELLEIFKPVIELEKTLRSLENEISEKSQDHDSKEFEKLLDKYSKLTDEFEKSNGYGYDSQIKGVLVGLGFNSSDFYKPINQLSGGQKTRVYLAKLLLQKPDILLLDEPTNHLDLDSIDWLEKYLKDYKGSVIIISHDRYFLDNVVSRILQLENTELKSYNGNYSTYMDKRKKEIELEKKKFEQQKNEMNRQKEIIKNLSLGGKRAIRQAQSREKMLKKMQELKNPSERKKASFKFTPSVKSGNDVLRIEDLKKSYDGKLLFDSINFNIYKGEKVGIIGPNGIGKSTLFKIIMGITSLSSGNYTLGANVNIGYFDQEQKYLNTEKTIADEIWDEHPLMDHFQIRSILAQFLFTGDDIFKEIGSLSGGEKARLALLKLMLSKSNFLLMDEPTNHLDVDSKEVLEDALKKYEGTVLVISHDRYFLNKVVDKILYFNSDKITEYLGNFDYYIEKSKLLSSNNDDSINTGITKTQMKLDRKKQKELEKKERAKKQQLSKLEENIALLENKISEYEHLLCSPDIYNDPVKSTQINKDLLNIKSDLEQEYEKWVELSS
ncbi:ABC-F family ATP-binding cassette domain-containing protein [Clostridiaceae bacterium M8S5]|nr:ABC-F family ATP-binding cassette domain-containing protein [Clostridiaceae bacterium M8S5]